MLLGWGLRGRTHGKSAVSSRQTVVSRKGRGEMKDIIHTVAAIVILILWLFAAVAVKLEIEEWLKRRGRGG